MIDVGGEGHNVHGVAFKHVVDGDGERVGHLTDVKYPRIFGLVAFGVGVGYVYGPARAKHSSC